MTLSIQFCPRTYFTHHIYAKLGVTFSCNECLFSVGVFVSSFLDKLKVLFLNIKSSKSSRFDVTKYKKHI